MIFLVHPGERSAVQLAQRRLRILMVDDDPMACELVRKALGSHGHSVRSRNVPLGTLADLRGDMPDLLLLDISMPALSGDKLLFLVREIFPRLKVVVYTAAKKETLPAEVRTAALVVRKGPPEELAEQLRALR